MLKRGVVSILIWFPDSYNLTVVSSAKIQFLMLHHYSLMGNYFSVYTWDMCMCLCMLLFSWKLSYKVHVKRIIQTSCYEARMCAKDDVHWYLRSSYRARERVYVRYALFLLFHHACVGSYSILGLQWRGNLMKKFHIERDHT